MATGETPFNMVYGDEAILRVEIDVEMARVQAYTSIDNEAMQMKELDLIEEK